MSIHFKLPKRGEALIAYTGRRATHIMSARRGAGGTSPRSLTKKQLDDLVETIRIAYDGTGSSRPCSGRCIDGSLPIARKVSAGIGISTCA